MKQVPFNKPHAVGKEFEYMAQALEVGHLSGDGPFTKRVHAWLKERYRVPGALLTHSATAALEMMGILTNLGPGDEVILPSFTFVSTGNAIALRGATPVFVDIREDTLNLDERRIEAAITPRTKGVMVVHYAGVAAAMDEITAIADRNGLFVVEDAAQAIGASYKGRPLGTIGAMGAISFHETKNVISGEGGALLIRDQSLIERAEIIREKGTNRTRFLRGQTDKYTWVDLGSSYLPSDIIAAFLWAQLENFETLIDRRLDSWNLYHEHLAGAEADGLLRRPSIPAYAKHNGHIYYVLVEAHKRDHVLQRLRERGIVAVFHYVPLHSSPAGRQYGRASGEMHNTDQLSSELIRLPLYPTIDEATIERVCVELTGALRDR